MSFEQLDNEKRYKEEKEKREKERNSDFWEEKEIYRQSSELLNELASQIAKEFGIEISEAKKLISGEISEGLNHLKTSINGASINSKKLGTAIEGAKKKIESHSKKHRENLKESLNQRLYTPENHEYLSSKRIFSEKIINRAKNPKNFQDQLLGIAVGFIDSTESVIVYSYELGKGIILSPYHLYLILTGKGEYSDFKDI